MIPAKAATATVSAVAANSFVNVVACMGFAPSVVPSATGLD